MSTELAIPQPRRAAHIEQVRPQTMGEIERVAAAFAHSGAFPGVQQMAQAYVRIMAGQEWGLGPMASMMGIYFIEGKPTLAAITVAATIKKSGIYSYKQNWITRINGKLELSKDSLNDNVVGCMLAFYENGEWIGDSTFTDTDAALAGLSHGVNWKKYPKNMYFSRAMTNGARWYCSDVFGGTVYTPDEIDQTIEVDGSGRPLNFVERLPEFAQATFGGTAVVEQKPADPRKPLTNTKLREMYEMAVPHFDEPKPASFGAWLESTVAPGWKARIDELTGKPLGITDAEKLAAQDLLEPIIQAASYRVTDPSPAEPSPVDDDVIDIAPDGFPVVEEPVGINEAQRRRIMAMFNERTDALVRLFPIAKSMDERRHRFAETVLNDKKKGSSKTWLGVEYTRVSDELEQLPKNGEAE